MTEIVAEISGNHGGELDNAILLIQQAKLVGADAVKFQCFDPVRLAVKRDRPEVHALANGMELVTLYAKVHTPPRWFPTLIKTCKEVDIPWFSSVFDRYDVAFLEAYDCPRYKISAFEMLDWELIRAVKETGKPIVMSVRSTKDVMVLHASDYDGTAEPLGFSDHGVLTPFMCAHLQPGIPMIEWHLRLPGVDTPDKDFSLTPDEMKRRIDAIRVSC